MNEIIKDKMYSVEVWLVNGTKEVIWLSGDQILDVVDELVNSGFKGTAVLSGDEHSVLNLEHVIKIEW